MQTDHRRNKQNFFHRITFGSAHRILHGIGVAADTVAVVVALGVPVSQGAECLFRQGAEGDRQPDGKPDQAAEKHAPA